MTASTETRLSAHEWAVEVDTHLALLWEARDKARAQVHRAVESLHYALKERSHYVSRSERRWPTTAQEAEEKVREALVEGTLPAWDKRNAESALASLEQARAEVATLNEEIAATNEIYEGWQRFYLVQNNGGHIHSSMNCSTCNRMGKATYFGWLPDLSGLTEAEAVAAHGTILCSVCFPSAPVEWTLGKAKPAGCEGSGQYVEPTEKGYRRYAMCPVCNTVQSRTSTGVLRKHQPKKES